VHWWVPRGAIPLNALISVSGWFVYWLDGSWQGFWLLEIGIFALDKALPSVMV